MIDWLNVWIESADTIHDLKGKAGRPHWPWTAAKVIDDGLMVYTRDEHHADALIECQGHWCAKNTQELRTMAGRGRVARIDWARDNFPITIPELCEMWKDGRIKTTIKTAAHWTNLNTGHETLYLGSRQSPKFMRFYNSRSQVRSEAELKHKVAAAIGAVYVDTGADLWAPVSRAMLRITARTSKDAKSLDWRWEEFTGSDMAVEFPRKQLTTLARVAAWLKTSVGPTFKAAAEALDGDITDFLSKPTNAARLAQFLVERMNTSEQARPPT